MQGHGSELKLSRKSAKMAEEEKFFSRISSKEASTGKANSSNSFGVYYGGASAGVPFRWESQPGTPKHRFSDNSIPPLTPPPSYYFTCKSHKSTQSDRNSNLLSSLFPKLSTTPKKLYMMSKSSSSSSRVSSCSSPLAAFISPKFQYRVKGVVVGSKSLESTACFGVSRDASSHDRYRMKKVKNAWRFILGHVSAHRAA